MSAESASRVLVDPSLLLAARTIEDIFAFVRYSQKGFTFSLPRTFYRFLSAPDEFVHEKPAIIDFFLQNAEPVILKTLFGFLVELSESGQISLFTVPSIKDPQQEWFYSALQSMSEPQKEGQTHEPSGVSLVNILFEEWVFLQEQSWIVSRTKRTFSHFFKAGAPYVQFSREMVERLVRKTLKKKDDENLTRLDVLRASAKWIAVGGSSMLAFAVPIIAATGTAASGFFMLFDP